MYRNRKNVFSENLKKVCLGNTVIKIILIPIAMLSAKLLSLIVDKAGVGNVSEVIKASLILGVIVLISVVLQTVVHIYLQKEKLKAVHNSKLCYLDCFLDNPTDRLFQANYGEVIENLTNDMDEVVKRYTELYPAALSSFLGVVGCTVFLFAKSPIAAGSMFLISLIRLFPPLIVKKYMQISYDQCEEIEAEITNHVVEAVDGFEIIKLYGLKKWWRQKMSWYHKEYIHIGRKADAVAAAQRSMYRLVDNIQQFGTYALIGLYIILGYCSVNDGVQAIYLSKSLYNWIQELFSTIPETAVSRNAEKRINKWLVYEKISQALPVSSTNEEIRIKDVSYQYDSHEILREINYGFEPDKNYLIQGSNGAGKTTVLNLLAGLLIPEKGEISVSGCPYGPGCQEPNPETLFYVPQLDPEFQYDVTTLFAILGEEKHKKLISIAERFGLTEIISLKKPICELSGGERKKVFLTIGFAMEPVWLLLDEPTNNLDSDGKQVLSELTWERKGIILISHDRMFYHATDCVIQIENGRIL